MGSRKLCLPERQKRVRKTNITIASYIKQGSRIEESGGGGGGGGGWGVVSLSGCDPCNFVAPQLCMLSQNLRLISMPKSMN